MKEFNKKTALVLLESQEDFPIDFDDAWRWLGFSTKQKALEKLKANHIEGLEFLTIGLKTSNKKGGRPSEHILLSTDCLKTMGMMAGTEKGREIRRYFLECEHQLKQIAQKAQATETRTVETKAEITEPSKSAADGTETDKTKQLTNINVKIPSSQRQWLANTARQVRRNNTKPVAPSDRVYPQHLVSIAIALLQKSNIDIEAAHSIRMEQDEATANINIKINHQQQEWLTATAKTIRNSNQHPTCPHERIYPQHLIAIAVEQLQNANVRWHKVGNVNEIQQRLAKPCHLHLV